MSWKERRISRTTTISLVIGMIFSALTSFLACGSSYPSESAGREFLDNLGKEMESISSAGRIKGVYRVKSFAKTNGISQGEMYTLEYDAELECLKVNTEPGGIFFQTQYSISCESVGQIVKAVRQDLVSKDGK